MKMNLQNLPNTIAIIFLLCWNVLTYAQIDSNLTNQFQQHLENQRSMYGDSGISAAVIMPNGDTWYGQAGVDPNGNAITDTTLFYGASTQKLYIATLILMLEQDGLIDLDNRYTQYIAAVPLTDTNVTIRQMLNHTSGIYNFAEHPNFVNSLITNPTQFYNPGDALSTFLNQNHYFAAGSGWHYSNSNYVMLGLVIQSITGNSLHDELRNRIWNPLGMPHTYLGAFENYSEPVAGLWADPSGSGSLTNFSSLSHVALLSVGWGTMSIVTTARDEAHFLRSLISGQVLADSSLQAMQNWVTIPGAFNGYPSGYSYGLGMERAVRYLTDTSVGHSGDLGNKTFMMHSISKNYTVVTMTNSETADPDHAFQHISALLSNTLITASAPLEKPNIDVTIYPNPTKDILRIETEENIIGMLIRNVHGQVLSQTGYMNEVDVSNLGAGLYFLELRSENGLVCKKFIRI